jgi:DNA polymerase-3 subunit delta'
MSGFDAIVGQEAAIASLRRLLAARRMPHALIFRGPEGVGKATVARVLGEALLCDADSGDACGTCRSCALAARGHHPDFHFVTFEPRDSDGELRKFIVVDQIRALARLAGVSPREGVRRVFIIDPADRMNAEAQNGLLKTLEEPPGKTVLILIASRPHMLLPTVRSRSFLLGFSSLRPPEMAQMLRGRGLTEAEALLRAALSGGRPGAALEIDLAAATERREEVLGMLEGLSDPGGRYLDRLPDMASALAGKDEPVLVEGLDLLQSLLRDSARAAAAADECTLIHTDIAPRLSDLGARLGAARAAGLVRSVDRVRGSLRVNANRTLLAETLLAAVAGGPLP